VGKEIVHPEESYDHVQEVERLHREVYCKAFFIPPPPQAPVRSSIASSSMPPSPAKSMMSRRGDYSDSVDMSSELGSEIDYEGEELKVRNLLLNLTKYIC